MANPITLTFSRLLLAALLLLPLATFAQLDNTSAEAPCEEAKAYQGLACMLTTDNIYAMEPSAGAEAFTILPLYDSTVAVTVLKVRCTDEGIQVNVQLASGEAGFFKVADMQGLRKMLRPATDADRGIVNF
jgi:hypothetical protein